MVSKLKIILPLFILLTIVGAYALVNLSTTFHPNSFSINQTNAITLENRTLLFFINNTDVADLIIASVTNSTNLTHETNQINHMFIDFNITNITRIVKLSLGNVTYYYVNVTIDSSRANETGTYSGWIDVNTTNELGLEMQYYRIPIAVNLINTINMTVLNVSNVTGSDIVQLGDILKVKVIPSYWNGTLIADLDDTNFSVSILHTNNTVLANANDSASLNVTSVASVGGAYYELTLETLPNSLFGGNYSITVQMTNSSFIGSNINNNAFAIDQTALKMIILNCAGGTLYVGNKTTCGFNLINYGYRTANLTNVSYNYGSCLNVAPTGQNVLFDLLRLANYTNYTTVTGLASGNCYLHINATTSDNVLWDVQNISAPQYSVSVYTAPTSPDVPLGKSGGGETTMNKVSKMSVTGPTTFEVGQGESTTQKVTVKNTGSYNIVGVKVTVDGASGACSVSGTADLTVLELKKNEKIFDMVCNIPSTLVPGTYTLTITASGTDLIKKPVSAEGSAVLVVAPDAATKQEIDANITEYKARLLELQSYYNSSLASGKNITNMDDLFNQITGLMTEIDSYITSDKYADAYGKLTEVGILLMQAEDELQTKGAELQITTDMLLAAAGVVVVAVIAGIAYLAKTGKIKKPNFSIRKKNSKKFVHKFKPKNVSKFDSFRDKFRR